MKITRCDRCGREYEPKELEPVTIREINVNRIRIGTTAGMSDGADLCQECLNEFKSWWEKSAEEVPEFIKKSFHVPDLFCSITGTKCTRCKPGPCCWIEEQKAT